MIKSISRYVRLVLENKLHYATLSSITDSMTSPFVASHSSHLTSAYHETWRGNTIKLVHSFTKWDPTLLFYTWYRNFGDIRWKSFLKAVGGSINTLFLVWRSKNWLLYISCALSTSFLPKIWNVSILVKVSVGVIMPMKRLRALIGYKQSLAIWNLPTTTL